MRRRWTVAMASRRSALSMMGRRRKADTDRKASRQERTAYCGKGHHL